MALSGLLNRLMTHRYWLGISGLFAVVAVVVAVVLDDEPPSPPAPAASTPPGAGSGNRVTNGSCIAQGSEISITCVPGIDSAEGLEFLRQSAEPNRYQMGSFALPADAPLEDFPWGGQLHTCGDEQIEWLRRYGDEAADTSVIQIRNAGTTGAKLNLSNLRVEDLEQRSPEPAIYFSCPRYVSADAGLEAMVDLDRHGLTKIRYPGRDREVPGSAFSFSLEPGEGGWLLTTMFQTSGASYTGRLVATAGTATPNRRSHCAWSEKVTPSSFPDGGTRRPYRSPRPRVHGSRSCARTTRSWLDAPPPRSGHDWPDEQSAVIGQIPPSGTPSWSACRGSLRGTKSVITTFASWRRA